MVWRLTPGFSASGAALQFRTDFLRTGEAGGKSALALREVLVYTRACSIPGDTDSIGMRRFAPEAFAGREEHSRNPDGF